MGRFLVDVGTGALSRRRQSFVGRLRPSSALGLAAVLAMALLIALLSPAAARATLAAGGGGGASPTPLGASVAGTSFSVGAFHNAAVKLDGSLWTWGSNLYGALGDGTTTNRLNPTRVGGSND